MAVTTDLDGFRIELTRRGLDDRRPWRETAVIVTLGLATGTLPAWLTGAPLALGAGCGLAVGVAVSVAGWVLDRPSARDERLVVEVEGPYLSVQAPGGIARRLPLTSVGPRPAHALGRLLTLTLPGSAPVLFEGSSVEEVREAALLLDRRCAEAAHRADREASAAELQAVQALSEGGRDP
ncbi:MAG: hypothetical protein KC621_05155 [Myxococcales bacterium]|nr:hypothetical protein [Myxococcales bacterium]